MYKEQFKLKELLKRKGISVYQISKETGVAPNSLYLAISGKIKMFPKYMRIFSEYVGVDSSEWFIE